MISVGYRSRLTSLRRAADDFERMLSDRDAPESCLLKLAAMERDIAAMRRWLELKEELSR